MNQEAVKLLKRKLFGNDQNKRVISDIVSILCIFLLERESTKEIYNNYW